MSGRHHWIGGAHAVAETISGKPGSIIELLVDEDSARSPQLCDLVRAARAAGVRVRLVARRELDRALKGRHQGVAAMVSESRAEDLGAFLAGLTEEAKKGLVLVALDQIQDPHNLGAIARSALNLGAAGLILPERRACPVTPAAIGTSAGAIQRLKVFSIGNLAQALAACREAGLWIYGADGSGEPVWKISLNTPLVLVIGSEGEGIRPLVRSSCDALVAVPKAPGGVESLNASCAASVLLYEIRRQAEGPDA